MCTSHTEHTHDYYTVPTRSQPLDPRGSANPARQQFADVSRPLRSMAASRVARDVRAL